MRRHVIADQGTAVVLGVAALVVAWVCLYDAWEGRGTKTPLPFRPFVWF